MRGFLALPLLWVLGCHDRRIGSDYFPETTAGQELFKRASFDLNCPQTQLTIERLGSQTAGVRGCSRQAVYVMDHGNWILNSPGIGDQQKPSEAR